MYLLPDEALPSDGVPGTIVQIGQYGKFLQPYQPNADKS